MIEGGPGRSHLRFTTLEAKSFFWHRNYFSFGISRPRPSTAESEDFLTSLLFGNSGVCEKTKKQEKNESKSEREGTLLSRPEEGEREREGGGGGRKGSCGSGRDSWKKGLLLKRKARYGWPPC